MCTCVHVYMCTCVHVYTCVGLYLNMSARRLEVYYYSNWPQAFVRYKRRGEHSWHHEEMLECTDVCHAGWHRIFVEANDGLDCVFCNADKSCWDNPPDSYGSSNYIMDVSALPANYKPPALPTTESGGELGACAHAHNGGRVVFTVVDGEVEVVDGSRPVLLVTDIDGTLIGHDDYLNEFNKIWLKQHVWRGSQLVYNTGRNLKDFLLAAQAHALHRPAYAIAGVGTEVYCFPQRKEDDRGDDRAHVQMCGPVGPKWCASRLDAAFEEEWLRRMQQSFHRPTAAAIIANEFPRVTINGDSYHDPWRISISAQTSELLHPDYKTMERLHNRFSDYKIILSGAGDWRYVDILPQQAGKLPPVEYIMTQLQFSPSQTLVCGDSGNDIDMFSHPEVLGVCVGNAQRDLLSFLKQTDSVREDEETELLRVHQIRDMKPTPNVLFATTPCAGGIIDALKHFGFD
eukprot:GHVS01084784.1.p1 GENE.GHVS01084784.1~~GHVS01084784.1.p1  ORF type:complete len:458 (-),score=72.68 GHVS01084784.1:318-1691(-)